MNPPPLRTDLGPRYPEMDGTATARQLFGCSEEELVRSDPELFATDDDYPDENLD